MSLGFPDKLGMFDASYLYVKWLRVNRGAKIEQEKFIECFEPKHQYDLLVKCQRQISKGKTLVRGLHIWREFESRNSYEGGRRRVDRLLRPLFF